MWRLRVSPGLLLALLVTAQLAVGLAKKNPPPPPPLFTVGHQVNCTYLRAGVFSCKDVLFENQVAEEDLPGTISFYVDIVTIVILTAIAAVSSGCLVGFHSMPLYYLKVLKRSSRGPKRKFAYSLLPLAKRLHWVAVSLLISFTLSIISIPYFLTRLLGVPLLVLGLSFAIVLLACQMIPMSMFHLHPMKFTYYMSWWCWAMAILWAPISYPLGMILDALLGTESALLLGRSELNQLLQRNINGSQTNEGEESSDEESVSQKLDSDEYRIVQGALNFRNLSVEDEYVPLDDVYMLPDDAVLNATVFGQIRENGHSRVPVYHKQRDMIIGIMHIFDIVHLSPSDNVPIDSVELYPVPRVSTALALHKVLTNFSVGSHQIAIVLDPVNQATPIGIITLEDVVEALIQAELMDEKEARKLVKQASPPSLVTGASASASAAFSLLTTTSAPILNAQAVSFATSPPATSPSLAASPLSSITSPDPVTPTPTVPASSQREGALNPLLFASPAAHSSVYLKNVVSGRLVDLDEKGEEEESDSVSVPMARTSSSRVSRSSSTRQQSTSERRPLLINDSESD